MAQGARGLLLGLLIVFVLAMAACGGNSNSSAGAPILAAKADAGPSQDVQVGTVVTLDGTGSTGANGAPVTYQWSVKSLPVGSAAVLANPSSAHPTFSPDLPGSYSFELVVSDGRTTQSATVSVHAGAASIFLVESSSDSFVVQGARLQSVAGLDITIRYDPAVFTSPHLTRGSATSGSMFASSASGNLIRFVAVNTRPVGGDGTGAIASVSFQRLSNAASPIDLTGVAIDANGKKLPAIFMGVTAGATAGSVAGSATSTAPGAIFPQITSSLQAPYIGPGPISTTPR